MNAAALDARITECKGNRITIAVDMDLTGSMLEMEDETVNAIGNLASGEALKRFDADGGNLIVDGTAWYLKGQQEKTYQLPYGMVTVGRHVYQRAEGGTTLCPLDDKARIVIKSTPRFAEMVAYKFAHNASPQVVEDLEQSQGRPCLEATL